MNKKKKKMIMVLAAVVSLLVAWTIMYELCSMYSERCLYPYDNDIMWDKKYYIGTCEPGECLCPDCKQAQSSSPSQMTE